MIKKNEQIFYRGTGKRKSSIAQVLLTPSNNSESQILINGKKAINFFPYKTLVQNLEQPLNLLNVKSDFNIIVKVNGGGFTGQSGATRLGIARALVKASSDYKIILRHSKMLTRDSRVKERKKYGLHGARRAPQYSKR